MKLPTMRFLALLVSVQATVSFPAGAGESALHPDGLNSDPGWALNRVGEEFSAGSTYSYPDTTTPVRLYLIDTAVSNPGSFTTANPKLTFEGPILVKGFNDPAVSTPRAHGTQMLSLIAGIDTGVAPGTPIHVVNYDIYPNPTTTTSLLIDAIIKAVQHHKNPNTPKMRAAICIATSSIEQSNSSFVEDSINYAVSEGIPVILSAGNIGQDASNIVPSSNGTKDGVICVGASDLNDIKLSNSNFGEPVDVLAPGLNVRTRSASATSPIVLMDGTSPAAALVTGAVLAKLSASPTHTPAGIESALKAAAQAPASGPRILRSVVAPTTGCIPPDVAPDGPITAPSTPLTWDQPNSFRASAIPAPGSNLEVAPPPAPDTDSDGIPDIVETFHGAPQGLPQGPEISLTADQKIQFKFLIQSDLFDESKPFTLRNGYTWRIRCSSGLSSWVVPEGELIKSTDAQGRAWLTASFPATQPSCFARIEIVAP